MGVCATRVLPNLPPPQRNNLQIKVLRFENDVTYTGHVNDKDQKHGTGKLIWPGKFQYTGQFQNDYMQGFGKIIYPDGTQYDGQFKDEKYHGIGILTYPNSEVYRGEFKNGLRHGRGMYHNSDGTPRHVGRYINDEHWRICCCFVCC